MDILVTGGAGFIGSALARLLATHGHHVIAFDNQKARPATGVTAVQGDVTDMATLDALLESTPVQAIVHMAGILSQGCEVDPAGAYRINVDATVHLLEQAHAHGVRRVVFTSSGAVYAPDVVSPVSEDGRLEPVTCYGIHKLVAEQWGLYYRRRHGLDFRVARLSALVGPNRLAVGSSTGFSSAIIEAGASRAAVTVDVGRDAAVPAVYIKDCADALARLVEIDAVPHCTYNISSMRIVAGDLADTVRQLRPETRVTFHPDGAVATVTAQWQRLELDATRAQRELGWQIRYPLEAMVKDFLASVQGSPLQSGTTDPA
jgi:UDP-glucose 4-epimerase